MGFEDGIDLFGLPMQREACESGTDLVPPASLPVAGLLPAASASNHRAKGAKEISDAS